MQQENNTFTYCELVLWKMIARWAEGKEVAAALSEDTFGGVD
jgi:hypothetical protein